MNVGSSIKQESKNESQQGYTLTLVKVFVLILSYFFV